MNHFREKEMELIEKNIQYIENAGIPSNEREKYRRLMDLKKMLLYDNLSIDNYYKYNAVRHDAGLGNIKISLFRAFIGANFIKEKEIEYINKRINAIDEITRRYVSNERVHPAYKDEYDALLRMKEILNSSTGMTESDIEEYRHLRNDLGTTGSKISKVELYELFSARYVENKTIKSSESNDDLLMWKIAYRAHQERKKSAKVQKTEREKKETVKKSKTTKKGILNRLLELKTNVTKKVENKKQEKKKKDKKTTTLTSKLKQHFVKFAKPNDNLKEDELNNGASVKNNSEENNNKEKLYKVVKTTPWEWTDKNKKAVLIVSGISVLTIATLIILKCLYPALDAQVKAEEIKMIINNMDGASALWNKVENQDLRDILHLHNKINAVELKKLINLPVDFNDKYEWVVNAKNIAGKFVGGEKISVFASNIKSAHVGLWQAISSVLGISGGMLLGAGIFKSNKYKEILKDINSRDIIFEREGADIDEWAKIIKKKIIYSRELSTKEYSELKIMLENAVKDYKENNLNRREESEKKHVLRRK